MSSIQHLKYEVELTWDRESGGKVCVGKFSTLTVDMPVEFGGKGRFPCPDELFFSAVGGCLLTTFLYFKEKLKLRLEGLWVLVKGTVELLGPEGYRITGIDAVIRAETGENEKQRAEKCAEFAKEYCHITRTLERAIPIRISAEIQTPKQSTR